jgi:hypothetical protein
MNLPRWNPSRPRADNDTARPTSAPNAVKSAVEIPAQCDNQISMSLLSRLLSCVGLACSLFAADAPPPVGPFQVIHYFQLDPAKPDAQVTVMRAIAELNDGIAKGGCPECAYHLWKVADQHPGPYDYLLISSFPGRAMYDQVLSSAEFKSVFKNWPILRAVVQRESYNRLVEVKPLPLNR